MLFKIKHRFSGAVLFKLETESLKLCVKAAIDSSADLSSADLSSADLSYADLRYANLRSANLSSAEGLSQFPYQLQACPRSGSFEAWKKGADHCIIKLKIPRFARRTATIISRKCRAELAIVKAIYDKDGRPVKQCSSVGAQRRYGSAKDILYRVGEFVSPDSYDASWTVECSHGIHFVMTKQEAEEF